MPLGATTSAQDNSVQLTKLSLLSMQSASSAFARQCHCNKFIVIITRYRPGGGETICPPSDGSSVQKSWRIYVRPRTYPQSTHHCWPAVAKLQAASVPIAWAAAPWNRQVDGRIALFQNAPLGRGIITTRGQSNLTKSRIAVRRNRANVDDERLFF